MKASSVVLSGIIAVGGGFLWMMHDMDEMAMAGPVLSGPVGTAFLTSKTVMLEFYADWCGPCKMVGPEVDKLKEEVHGKAEVVRLNIDENHDLAHKYGVSAIPCFIVFKDREETVRQVGAIPPQMMREMLGL
jgi:thioredoxin 1